MGLDEDWTMLMNGHQFRVISGGSTCRDGGTKTGEFETRGIAINMTIHRSRVDSCLLQKLIVLNCNLTRNLDAYVWTKSGCIWVQDFSSSDITGHAKDFQQNNTQPKDLLEMASANDFTHEEIWDDSALVESWNQALDEYKVCSATRPDKLKRWR